MTDEHFDMDAALAMVSGQDMNKFYDLQIDETDKQALRNALEDIFQGSSVALWIAGNTLGDAWKIALDNMRDEMFATSRRDNLTVFLQRAVFEHRNIWMEKIRTNDNRGQKLQLNATDTTKMMNQANFQKQHGYDVIKQIFEKYDSGFKPAPVQIMEKPIKHERVYEREERVRERTK